MKKWRFSLFLLGLALLVPLLICAKRYLPLNNQALIAKKYEGWSGVLRLWVYEGWPVGTGSISPWLNRCIERFEKGHAGVYVQPQFVDADAIADFNDSGIYPPDMLLFPPGLLASPNGLVRLSVSESLRPELAHCGQWRGIAYAVPVAMGGYMWAWNRSLIDGIPIDWETCDGTLAAPKPEAWRRWDAALLGLCAGRRQINSDDKTDSPETELSGLELGLSLADTPAPSATPAPNTCVSSCRLPDDFEFSDDAWRQFINGAAAAMPVTQREVYRLQRLSEQGKGPDWQLSVGDTAFTDQLLFLGIVSKTDADDQQALCAAFLACLLEEASQSELCRVGAFSVTGIPSGYRADIQMAAMDISLRDNELTTPGCFDSEWAENANFIVRKFTDHKGESFALWRELREYFSKNTNIY